MLTKDEVTVEEVLELVQFKRDGDGCLRVVHVLGDVWGNIRGFVEGNVYGNIYGDVEGEVLGDAPTEDN